MRISVNRVFDDQIVAKTNAYQELKPQIDYQQKVNGEMIQLSQGNIGFQTNIDCQIKSVAFKDNEYLTVTLAKQPIGILIIKQDPVTYPIKDYVWRLTQSGETEVAISFDAPDINTKVTATLLALFS